VIRERIKEASERERVTYQEMKRNKIRISCLSPELNPKNLQK
jgi:hypothetical protein